MGGGHADQLQLESPCYDITDNAALSGTFVFETLRGDLPERREHPLATCSFL